MIYERWIFRNNMRPTRILEYLGYFAQREQCIVVTYEPRVYDQFIRKLDRKTLLALYKPCMNTDTRDASITSTLKKLGILSKFQLFY